MALIAVILIALVSPLVALLGAMFRAVVLFWPTMIVFGILHSYLAWVPALGAAPVFWIIALLSLLIPVSSQLKSE